MKASYKHDVPVAIDKMVERIVDGFNPLRIILFGSQARGTADKRSDIDLLVVMENGIDRHNSDLELMRAIADLPVDRTVLSTTPEHIDGVTGASVVYYALREGVILYERSHSAVDAAGYWFRYAAADMVFVDTKLNATPPVACRIAHRAALNAFRAALALEHVKIPFTHDLNVLRTLLPDNWAVKSADADLARITLLSGDEKRAPHLQQTEHDMSSVKRMVRNVFRSIRADLTRRGVLHE